MKAIRESIPFFLLAVMSALVDQVVQEWLLSVLQPSEARMPDRICHPLLRFNPDFAWGLALPFDGATAISVFIGFGFLLAAGLAWLLLKTRGVAAAVVALLLGSALNACLDRLRYGAVVDFMICQGSGLTATFNVSDLLACFGLLLWAGTVLGGAIGRRRINMSNIPRDDSGTV